MVLFHFSPVINRASIISGGLVAGEAASGYGVPPLLKAVYLFHEDNINIIFDLMNEFKSCDIYQVSNVDRSLLAPDEDSESLSWMNSIKSFGTVAHLGDIAPEDVKLFLTVESHVTGLSK